MFCPPRRSNCPSALVPEQSDKGVERVREAVARRRRLPGGPLGVGVEAEVVGDLPRGHAKRWLETCHVATQKGGGSATWRYQRWFETCHVATQEVVGDLPLGGARGAKNRANIRRRQAVFLDSLKGCCARKYLQ